jgi:hypothetical protein
VRKARARTVAFAPHKTRLSIGQQRAARRELTVAADVGGTALAHTLTARAMGDVDSRL